MSQALPDNGYWVCFDTTDNNSCDTIWWPNGAQTWKTLEDLAPGTYYWQVKEAATSVEADGGQWWSFTKAFGVSGKFAPENRHG
ncbi:MAG TPA: hypothetical protein VFV78_11195 [Vicinamibacterales bacterium]|nr:hypothetical protein [Vicinamibacterales bacterium]